MIPQTSLTDYELIAIKQIKYFWKPYYPRWMMGMDLINKVISANIKADMTYDVSKGAGYKTWRNIVAITAISNFYQKISRKKHRTISLRDLSKDKDIEFEIADKNFSEEIVAAEEIIDKTLNDIEKDLLYRRCYKNQSYREIADSYKISKQRVAQKITKIKRKLNEAANSNNY